MNNINISEKEKIVLQHLFTLTKINGEFCVGFEYLSGMEYNLDVKEVGNACRSLKKKGFAEFYRGLMTEENEVAGSGYCITQNGIDFLKNNNYE